MGPLSPHFLPAIICVNIMNHKQKYLPQENIESKTYISQLSSNPNMKQRLPGISCCMRLVLFILQQIKIIILVTCYNMLENVFSVWLIMICTKERKVDVAIAARIIR